MNTSRQRPDHALQVLAEGLAELGSLGRIAHYENNSHRYCPRSFPPGGMRQEAGFTEFSSIHSGTGHSVSHDGLATRGQCRSRDQLCRDRLEQSSVVRIRFHVEHV